MRRSWVRIVQQRTATPEEVKIRLQEIDAEQRRRKLKASATRSRNIILRSQVKVTGNWKLYVLQLEHGKYYVGITRSANTRFRRHLSGKGAYWTRLHPPIKTIYLRDLRTVNLETAERHENIKTREVAGLYGVENVRGGKWCGRADVQL